jgi:hypothetical protein
VNKMARFQPKGNIMKKLAIFVFLRVEEKSEVVNYVIEQVVYHNTSLDCSWECIQKLIIFLYLRKSVVSPIVLKVIVNLPI